MQSGPLFPRGPVFIPRHDDPPELFPNRSWDKHVRLGATAALIVAALIGAFAFRSTIEGGLSSRHADAAPPLRVVAPFSVEAAARADRNLEELATAINAFRERRTDFLAQRIDCETLGAGYADADFALLRTAVVVRAERDSLNVATIGRYTALLAAMDTVNTFFDSTGCVRP